MRISTTSASLFYLDREKLLKELHKFSQELVESSPFVKEVYLFGSLLRGDYRGLSDVDLIAVVSEDLSGKNFWRVYKELFNFFADKLSIAFDLIVTDTEGKEQVLERLKPTLLLAKSQ
ncbi:MAG: nucleotidyltransferase domain-containing protein [Aquificaceae bacterium]|nr:nucleotidyltransferase domain-containing protein [Aquificaceae bacterium]MCS7307946.1 nucleotidyltransferase domain-containing protein [Aquificaceae bacterium]MCX7989668.1 nucleotidyltransferase domain-containing protein [Aquificaceae bacterium]